MNNRKTSLIVPKSRPRNPFHEAIKHLHAGAHGASHKAVRQQQRQNLLRHVNALLEGDTTEFDID